MKTQKFKFLSIAALVLALAGLAGLALLGSSLSAVAAPGAAPSAAMQNAAMPALPEAVCELAGDVRTCELWALPGTLTLPGKTVPIWGFSSDPAGPASLPGPILRADPGETLRIVFHNEVPGEVISLAFPGQESFVPDLDGVAQGGSAVYTFGPLQEGAFLYEAGLTPGGARQVAMGLFGPLLVGEPPVGVEEVVLVFSEVDPAFNENPTGFLMNQFRTKYWLINGSAYPDSGWIGVNAGSSVLLRYLNAGASPYSIGLLGLDQEVVATDGVALPFSHGAVATSIAPGQTLDTRVNIPADAVDETLYPLYNASLHQHNNNQRLVDGSRRLAFGGMLTFLKVSDGAGPSSLGPVASGVSVDPAKTNGSEAVTLSATLTDDDGNVVGFEYFIDSLGIAGSGPYVAISPENPANVSQVFSPADLAALSGGQHTFYIRGVDEYGHWGNPGSAVLTLDIAGPHILGLGLAPNPTNGTVNVLLSGTADDRQNGNSNVVAAEYRIDGGAWQPMSFSPIDSPFTGLSATIDAAVLAALPEAAHTVEVRAMDELDNWSLTYGTVSLNLDKTGPQVMAASLTPSTIDLNLPVPSTIRLTATIEDQLSGGVQSTLSNAEAFINTLGDPGTGVPLYPSDGLFDEVSEDAYYDIPTSSFGALDPAKTYYVYVVGKDKAGNWGPAGSVQLNLIAPTADTTGPVVSDVEATPNPTAGATSVTLRAVATDSQSNIAGAVWFQGTTTKKAKLYAMSAVDGIFDEPSEDLIATINIRNWKAGEYPISVWAYDAKGNWGDFVTITLVVTK
jgi:hypothetical protein